MALPPALRIGYIMSSDSTWFRLRRWSALNQTGAGCARRAIAQMKPTISRAIAVVTTTFGLPVAARRRYRAHKRSCAFQAMSRTAGGSPSRRS